MFLSGSPVGDVGYMLRSDSGFRPKRQWIPRMGRGTLEVPDGTGSRRAGIYPEEKIEPERTTIK